MKTILATLSAVDVLMGVLLLVVFGATDDTPLVVLALGIGMLIQAGYTLAFTAGLLAAIEPWSSRALLAGQTVALLVGSFGFLSSALYNISPTGGDYEYGPMAVGAMIALHAAVTLWMFAIRPTSAHTEAAG